MSSEAEFKRQKSFSFCAKHLEREKEEGFSLTNLLLHFLKQARTTWSKAAIYSPGPITVLARSANSGLLWAPFWIRWVQLHQLVTTGSTSKIKILITKFRITVTKTFLGLQRDFWQPQHNAVILCFCAHEVVLVGLLGFWFIFHNFFPMLLIRWWVWLCQTLICYNLPAFNKTTPRIRCSSRETIRPTWFLFFFKVNLYFKGIAQLGLI